jgi:hypothetical protein
VVVEHGFQFFSYFLFSLNPYFQAGPLEAIFSNNIELFASSGPALPTIFYNYIIILFLFIIFLFIIFLIYIILNRVYIVFFIIYIIELDYKKSIW